LRTASFWWVGGYGFKVCDCGGVGLCFGWLPWDSVAWVWVCRRGCGFAGVGMVGLGGCHGIRWRGFGFASVGCGGFGFAGMGIVGLGGLTWVWVCQYGFEIGVRKGDSERRVSKKKKCYLKKL
jgi:hypothetical protein